MEFQLDRINIATTRSMFVLFFELNGEKPMSIRQLVLPALSASFVVAQPVAVADEHQEMGQPMMMKHHEFNLEQQVENAKTAGDHEKLAKRFDDDAARYEAKAAEDAHEMAQIHRDVAESLTK